MFCTVSLMQNHKRFHKKYKIETIEVGKLEFIKIICAKNSNFKKIENKLSSKVDFAIVADNIFYNEFKKMPLLDSESYLKKVAFFTFKNILNLMPKNYNRVNICIKDANADYSDLCYSASKCSSSIKIVTENESVYKAVCEDLYEEKGFYPSISDEVGAYDILFDFERVPRVCFNSGVKTALITKNCVRLGKALRRFVPQGISECDFAAALSMYPEYKRLKLLDTTRMMVDGEYFDINTENIKNFLDNKVED